MKIVSLLGSATEILFALGVGDRVVGISHECDYPPEAVSRPRVSRSRFEPAGLTSREIDTAVRESMLSFGGVYQIDEPLLSRLAPDLIIAQAICEVCAVPTASVHAAIAHLPHPPRVLSLDSHSIDEILSSILAVGDAVGVAERARALVAGLRERIAAVEPANRSSPRRDVLLLEWLDPPFAPGHWVPEMVELAGGHNLLGEPHQRSLPIPPEAITGLDPDVLLIEPCGFTLDEALADARRHHELLEQVAPRALASGRAWVLDSAYFSRSGPRVVDGIELLATLLREPEESTSRRGMRLYTPNDLQ
jgi:iron complex transport system substrate-binding protein